MVFQAPMQLFHNKMFFGTIVTYGYATPWAIGRLVAQEKDQHDLCRKACSFLQWVERMPDNLSVEEDDKLYQAGLTQRGLSEEDINWYGAQWTIVTSDGEERPISILSFFEDDFIEWRW